MNLPNLFQAQKVFRERLNYNEPDRFDKIVMATFVELGECANEWRAFKYWSKDQEPRRIVPTGMCTQCAGTGNQFFDDEEEEPEDCHKCEGDGEEHKHPLLEEYADGLLFIVGLGLEINFDQFHYVNKPGAAEKNVLNTFTDVYENLITFKNSKHPSHYRILMEEYLALGDRLGYTEKEIEKAYYEKNRVNHLRQEQGY